MALLTLTPIYCFTPPHKRENRVEMALNYTDPIEFTTLGFMPRASLPQNYFLTSPESLRVSTLEFPRRFCIVSD